MLYGSMPLTSSVPPVADEEVSPFLTTRKVIAGVAICATLAVAGVLGLESKASPEQITQLVSKTDVINSANEQFLKNLPDVAKWQGSKRQADSWEKFGTPTQLKSLPREEWKECSTYTKEEIAQIDEYVAYWEKRFDKDKNMIDHMDYMQETRGRPKEEAKKTKKSGEQFGCDYYSVGLSGPFNGIKDTESKEWKLLQGMKKNPPESDFQGVTDLTGSCFADSASYWGCDWDWDTSFTIISTTSVSFSLDSTADFDFYMDLDNCDMSVDIGGSVYFSLSAYGYDYDYNIWESPSLSASTTKLQLDVAYSIFTFGVDFNNEVYADYGTACCFNFWLMTLRPGFDVWFYSYEYPITYGSVQIGLSIGSSDYCYDMTPSRKLAEKLEAVTQRAIAPSGH